MEKELTPRQQFGAQVRAWRKERNMSQTELATRVNLDQSFISKLENGYRVYGRVTRVVSEFTGLKAAA